MRPASAVPPAAQPAPPAPLAQNPFAWTRPWTFADAARARADADAWTPSRAAERKYERQLVSVARQIKGLIETGGSPEQIEAMLRRYADTLEPWARQSAANMVFGCDRKNRQAWMSASKRMGMDLTRELGGSVIGDIVRKATEANARLIKSLALDTADKIAGLAREALVTGERTEDLMKRMYHAGEVTLSRARTIAHTEVSKAGTALTHARAASIGSPGYIWRTARDGDTRDSHRAMEGKFVPWDKPPTLDRMEGHAGAFPNCRCYPEPVIPKDTGGVHKPPLPTQGQEKNAGKVTPLSHYERGQAAAGRRFTAPVEFVKSETVEQANRFAGSLGISADYSGHGPGVANLINKGLSHAHTAGFAMPDRVYYDRTVFAGQDAPAAYLAGTQTLALNPDFNWRELRQWMASRRAEGYLSTDKAEHLVWHELAHAHIARTKPDFFAAVQARKVVLSDAEKRIAAEVGEYAREDPLEFISEVFAGRAAGKKYSKSVMALYRRLGGQE